jgi:hypothetical protein
MVKLIFAKVVVLSGRGSKEEKRICLVLIGLMTEDGSLKKILS